MYSSFQTCIRLICHVVYISTLFSSCVRLFAILFNKMTYSNRGLTNTGFGTMNKPPPQAIKTVYVTLPARTTVMPGEGGGGGGKAPKNKKLVYKEVKKSIKKHKRKQSRTRKRKQHRAGKKKRSTKSKIINF